MKYKIISSVLILLIVFILPVFAEPMISVKTDADSYKKGDTIIISGKVNTIIKDTPVTIQIFNGNNLIQIAQITVSEEGDYSHAIIAQGNLWSNAGEYKIKASYVEGNNAETQFTFSPKTKTTVVDTFDMHTDDYGTFDVKYSINGGTVKNMYIDKDTFALIVVIDATNNGSVTLEIPRKIIDAKKQDETDETFIVIIDGIQVPYQETESNSNSRTITINFQQKDSDIEIIGTTIIPEFGTITIMILLIGIITTIMITKNKFQIHI